MDFYYTDLSAPCRSVMLLAKTLGVNLNKKELDLSKKEQMKPEFIALNPQHCVPTLVDGDLVLWESLAKDFYSYSMSVFDLSSRAICTYLASKYGKDDSLYPKDPKTRFHIDRLLYFDLGTLTKRFGDYLRPIYLNNEKPNPENLRLIHESLEWLDGFIKGHDFVVGNNMTVADFSLITIVSTFIASGIDVTGYPHVKKWADRCKNQMKGYDTENEVGLKLFSAFVEKIMPS